MKSRQGLHDYCLMFNHYRLTIFTPECMLSTGMHRLLTLYVQYFKRQHGRRGASRQALASDSNENCREVLMGV